MHRVKPIVTRPTAKPNLEVAAVKTSMQFAADIDDIIASPWIGLHYRHEFLLLYRHESLELPNSTADRPNMHDKGSCGGATAASAPWCSNGV